MQTHNLYQVVNNNIIDNKKINKETCCDCRRTWKIAIELRTCPTSFIWTNNLPLWRKVWISWSICTCSMKYYNQFQRIEEDDKVAFWFLWLTLLHGKTCKFGTGVWRKTFDTKLLSQLLVCQVELLHRKIVISKDWGRGHFWIFVTDFVDNRLYMGSRRNMILDSLGEAEHVTDDLKISSGPLTHSKTEGMCN